MKLTLLKSGLPLVLAATLMSGEQGQPVSTTQAVKQSQAKPSTAQATAPHKMKTRRVVRKRSVRVAHRSRAKRPAYRPEYAEQHVEVINGDSTKQVVFNDEKKPAADVKSDPSQMKVEVVNGTASDTQYFYAATGQTQLGADSKQPVVLRIQSSDTRVTGGNKHPVVTGITAVGPVDAKSANSGGAKVTTGVAPKSKRPEYQPETQ